MSVGLLLFASLIYILFICILYCSKKRVDLFENKIYFSLIISNIIGVILELICLYYPKYTLFSNIAVRIFMIYLLIWGGLLTLYIATISSKEETKAKKLVLPFIASYILFSIPVTFLPMDFIAINNSYYTDGICVKYVILMSSLYMGLDTFIFFRHLKTIAIKKCLPIIAYFVFMGIVVVIQRMYPEISIITAAETFVTLLMYHTIENPDLQMLRETEMARNQAERANNAKSDFLSSMSHEIRTPLNAIVGLSEDIATFEDQVPSQVVEDTEDIRAASQTLLEIVGNILDISKIESGKLEITNEVYKPKEIIETIAKIDATRIGDKPIDFKINIAEDLPYEVIGDRLHIKQIINNLLTNAFKYTEQGEVSLTAKCINKDNICNLFISVQDTGRGIRAEDINKLFEKFERLDVEKNTTTEGTGLGLAITKALVEMMGGKINVQSQFGKGSLFVVNIPQTIKTITNPLTDTQALRLNEIRKAALANTDYGFKKVLIVDDNKLNIKVARRALDDFNFEIDECYDGQECLDKIVTGKEYDLILMDIMMPNMSGETAMAKLKENPDFNIPTIALTADAVVGAKEKYISEGFVDYIAKPFSKDQIKEKLDIVFKSEATESVSLFDDSVEKELLDMSKSLNDIKIENKSEPLPEEPSENLEN